jgi:hypothetical protein
LHPNTMRDELGIEKANHHASIWNKEMQTTI